MKCQEPPPDMTDKEKKKKKKNLLKILNEYKTRMFPLSKGLSELQPQENYTAEDIKMMKKINAKMAKYFEDRAKEWEKYELLRRRERKGLLENNQNVINWEALSYEGRQIKLKELQDDNENFVSSFSSHQYTSSEEDKNEKKDKKVEVTSA